MNEKVGNVTTSTSSNIKGLHAIPLTDIKHSMKLEDVAGLEKTLRILKERNQRLWELNTQYLTTFRAIRPKITDESRTERLPALTYGTVLGQPGSGTTLERQTSRNSKLHADSVIGAPIKQLKTEGNRKFKPKSTVKDNQVKHMATLRNHITQGVLIKQHIPRENCRACGGFDRYDQLVRWIFCVTCGDSFHLGCASDAPSIDHPIHNKLLPNTHEPWFWECDTCRCCTQCRNVSENWVLLCFHCKRNFCSVCDEGMNTELGYYYLCEECSSSNPRRCLNCRSKLSNPMNKSLFCASCSRRRACPRCKIRYSNNDYSQAMIGCSACDNWTHAECLGLTKQQYKAMGDSDEPFYCIDCEEKCVIKSNYLDMWLKCDACDDNRGELVPSSLEVEFDRRTLTTFVHPTCSDGTFQKDGRDGLELGEAWFRQGALDIFIPKSTNKREIFMKKSFWSRIDLKRRTFINIKIEFNVRWDISSVSIYSTEHPTDGFTSSSLISAFSRFMNYFDSDAARTLNLGRVDWSTFFKYELLRQLIRGFKLICQARQAQSLCKDSTQLIDQCRQSQTSLADIAFPKRPYQEYVKTKMDKKKRKPPKSKITQAHNIMIEAEVLQPVNSCAKIREYHRLTRKKRVCDGILWSPILPTAVAVINKSRSRGPSPFQIARSRISGFGLFTTRPIISNARVLEYCGELVGQLMADRREILYGLIPIRRHDCYLFRLGTDRIIDATLKANMARFINHSCDPNCESRVEKNKIIIYAIRDIDPGDELTYDYKFSKDGVDDEASCYCGAAKCRGFMN